MSRFEEDHLDRRGFLAAGMSAAVPTFLSARSAITGSVANDERFFQCDGKVTDALHPIPPSRFVMIDNADELPALAFQILDSYGEPGYADMMKSRLQLAPRSSCRAGYFVIGGKPSLRDWWLFGNRNKTCIRPVIMHFTSRDSLEECGVTGSLVAKITTRLHRKRKRIHQLSTDLPQLLRLINWEIIEAVEALTE